MKALVRYSHLPKKLKIKEIPFPKIGNSNHEAIIEVKYAGICGRDIEHYNSKIAKKKIPSVLGHEFSGVIQRINKNKYNIKNGDRVTCETVKSVCKKCNLCKKVVVVFGFLFAQVLLFLQNYYSILFIISVFPFI